MSTKRFFGTNCKWGKKGGSVWYAFFEVLSITRIKLGVLKTRSNLDHLLSMDGGPLYLQHRPPSATQSSRAQVKICAKFVIWQLKQKEEVLAELRVKPE